MNIVRGRNFNSLVQRAFCRNMSSSSNVSGKATVGGKAPVQHDVSLKPGHVKITEGTVTMDYDEKEAVFYNRVQVFNRDLSIQVIRLFAEIREKEKEERHQAKVAKFALVVKEQEELRAKGETKGLMEKTMATNHQYKDVEVECYICPKTNKEVRSPFPTPKGIHICDALAGTGLRSIRYLKEIPLVRHMSINDLLPEATATALENCRTNLTEEEMKDRITINNGDAINFMYENKDALKCFDVIDLDPYGTAAPFLDSAVQAVSNGGLLCITCTDMAVLSGNFPEKCFSLYGTVGLKAKYMHETSLRTLLHAIDSSANRHKRHIVPWLSLSVDFYVRVFVRVFESPLEVKKSLTRRMMVHQSTQCESFYMQPMGTTLNKGKAKPTFAGAHCEAPAICPETGGRMRLGGPYWAGQLHEQSIVDEILKRVSEGDPTGNTPDGPLPFAVTTAPRIQSVLGVISEELKDVPLFYTLPDLSSTVHVKMPVMNGMRNGLNNAGYRFSQFHHEPLSVKTDAPPQVVWDIMRAHCELNPPEGSKHKQTSASAKKILANEIKTKVDFKFYAKLEDSVAAGNTNAIWSGGHSSWRKANILPTNTSSGGDGDKDESKGQDPTRAGRNRGGARFMMNPDENWGVSFNIQQAISI